MKKITDSTAETKMNELQTLHDTVFEFQSAMFPESTIAGKMRHLQDEANEVIADPTDLVEFSDIFILLLGAARQAGFTAEQLIEAAHAKVEVCKTRKWSKPDSEGVYHHIEEDKEAA